MLKTLHVPACYHSAMRMVAAKNGSSIQTEVIQALGKTIKANGLWRIVKDDVPTGGGNHGDDSNGGSADGTG